MVDFNQMVISNYNPISAKGGRRHKSRSRKIGGRKYVTKSNKRSNKSRTRRRHR